MTPQGDPENSLETIRTELARLETVDDATYAAEVRRIEAELPWVKVYTHWNAATLREAILRLLAKTNL